ncbi:hypothetical protein [Saccharolobus islandicus]|nr:hypothetical protein [Sulfolobus islandicus]
MTKIEAVLYKLYTLLQGSWLGLCGAFGITIILMSLSDSPLNHVG